MCKHLEVCFTPPPKITRLPLICSLGIRRVLPKVERVAASGGEFSPACVDMWTVHTGACHWVDFNHVLLGQYLAHSRYLIDCCYITPLKEISFFGERGCGLARTHSGHRRISARPSPCHPLKLPPNHAAASGIVLAAETSRKIKREVLNKSARLASQLPVHLLSWCLALWGP